MEGSRNAYKILVGRLEGMRSLRRPRHRWKDNIKLDLKEVGCDTRNWKDFAQDRDQWRAYVRVVMNLRFLESQLVCFNSRICFTLSLIQYILNTSS